MTLFILGLIVFFGAHLFTASARGARGALIRRLGAGPYKGFYSLVSIAGFVLIIMGWPKADGTVLFVSPYWMIHVVYLLMLISLVLLASAYLPKGRIAPAVKHPMLASVKIWAFAHLLVNGDVRSLLLFGAFLAYAIFDRIAVKRRGEAVPAPGSAVNDLFAVGVGAAAWAALFFWLHPYVAGVPIPR